MKIAIIGAMKEEISFLLPFLVNKQEKKINNFTFYLGTIDEKELIIVRSGVGKVMSALLVATLINNFAFDYIINFGVAGGYIGTNIGDVIVGKTYVYGDVDVTIDDKYRYGHMPNFPFLFTADPYLLNKTTSLEPKYGTIMTSDSFIFDNHKISALLNKYYYDLKVLAFDMESAAFAQACHYFALPFIAIRAISDIIGCPNQQQSFIENLEFAINKGNDFLLGFLKKL